MTSTLTPGSNYYFTSDRNGNQYYCVYGSENADVTGSITIPNGFKAHIVLVGGGGGNYGNWNGGSGSGGFHYVNNYSSGTYSFSIGCGGNATNPTTYPGHSTSFSTFTALGGLPGTINAAGGGGNGGGGGRFGGGGNGGAGGGDISGNIGNSSSAETFGLGVNGGGNGGGIFGNSGGGGAVAVWGGENPNGVNGTSEAGGQGGGGGGGGYAGYGGGGGGGYWGGDGGGVQTGGKGYGGGGVSANAFGGLGGGGGGFDARILYIYANNLDISGFNWSSSSLSSAIVSPDVPATYLSGTTNDSTPIVPNPRNTVTTGNPGAIFFALVEDLSAVPRWVAVGNGTSPTTSIQWSPNGRTWYDASSGGFSGGGGYYGLGVAYDGTTWVAVGNGTSPTTSIQWSPDGRTWRDASSGGFSGGGGYYGLGVAYDGTTWVAVGCGTSPETSIQWSPDGRTWRDASSGGFQNGYGYGVAYGNGVWVAVGDGVTPEKRIQWSPDGKTWHDASSGGFDIGDGRDVAYDGSGWVAVGQGSTPEKSILWSPDGRTWYDVSSGGFSGGGEGVAYDGTTWVAVGNGTSPTTSIQWSPDGRTWRDVSSGGFNGGGEGVASTRSLVPTTTTTTGPTTTTTTRPPVPPPCFVAGTQILTPSGYKAVEDIQSGDYVLTADKRRVSVKLYSFTIKATADTAPYRIAANAIAPGQPLRDLHVSPRHAIKDAKGRWQIPKFIAYHNKKIQQYGVGESITYYHIECPNFYNDNLLAEGMEVESYKYNQGSPGIIYMWSDALGGWERVQNKPMPAHITTHVIYSI